MTEFPNKQEEGPICQGLALENIDSVRNPLAKQLGSLPLVREDLPDEFWDPDPIDTITGIDATIEAVIDKIKKEANIILQYVKNIHSLSVTINLSEHLDGVNHDGQEDHVVIQMTRHFRNGGSDIIIHHIFRIGDQTFKFAYLPQ